MDLLQSSQKLPKTDRRVTGSELIDSSLQEILGYVLRDYVIPWYNLISLHDEFPEVTVRQTSQSLAINISNRYLRKRVYLVNINFKYLFKSKGY